MTQRGVSLYFAVVITSLLLAIALGLSAILVSQIKNLKEMGDSTIAFFAADTGIENLLYLDNACLSASCTWSGYAFYDICETQRMQLPPYPTTTCVGLYSTSTTFTFSNGSDYFAFATTVSGQTIFQSRGTYQETQRAIQASR